MTPKKVRNLLPLIAIENKEDLTLLTKLNGFYWDKVREQLSHSHHVRINILNLGIFVRKSWVIPKLIEKYTDILRHLENTKRQMVIDAVTKDLEHVLKIQEFEKKEQERKELIKLKKYEYNKNLEK